MKKEEIMKKQERLKEKVDTHRPSHGRRYDCGALESRAYISEMDCQRATRRRVSPLRVQGRM
jgi:hypothetical protein